MLQPVKSMQAVPAEPSALTHWRSFVHSIDVPFAAQKLAPPVVRKQRQELPPAPQSMVLVLQKFCVAVQVPTLCA